MIKKCHLILAGILIPACVSWFSRGEILCGLLILILVVFYLIEGVR